MCLLSFLKLGSIGYSLGIVQWDFTRRDHPGNPGRVSGSGLVSLTHGVARKKSRARDSRRHPKAILLVNVNSPTSSSARTGKLKLKPGKTLEALR